jgi:hypothetical protein
MSVKVRFLWQLGSLVTVTSWGIGLSALLLFGFARAAPSPDLQVNSSSSYSGQSWIGNVGLVSVALTPTIHIPLLAKTDVCLSVGESYGVLAVSNYTTTPPAETHPDINLAVRGYTPTSGYLGLVDYGPTTDPNAPQLAGLFTTTHAPTFTAVYQVYDWNWPCCRGDPIQDPPVTLADLAATPGDVVRVPGRSNGDIGNGYVALVLYASTNRITLKFTSEDSMVQGYGLHLENICVDSSLLALYQQLNQDGRHELPALQAGQAVGSVLGTSFGVAVRDTGAFMDPRSHNDWWIGY